MAYQLFSVELEAWIKSKKPKTLAGINEVFGEKSFAVIFFILMCFPALPLPTGGVTHIFEIVVMLLALEMIIGRRSIWLPQRWQHAKLPENIEHKVIPFIFRRIRWFEKCSKPSQHDLLNNRAVLKSCGVMIFLFSLSAFMAPPFSGLDTLPALGVVVISLALLFSDIRLFVVGNIIGLVGMGIIASLGTLVFESFRKIL